MSAPCNPVRFIPAGSAARAIDNRVRPEENAVFVKSIAKIRGPLIGGKY